MKTYPVLCMDCYEVVGRKAVEKSTTICNRCLAIRYPKDEDAKEE